MIALHVFNLNYVRIEQLEKIAPKAIIINQKAEIRNGYPIFIYSDEKDIETAKQIAEQIREHFFIDYSSPVVKIVRAE